MIFGKTIVITGVSSGIGQRTAELAAHMGADVIGIDVNAPAVEVGRFICGDISSPAGVFALVAQLPSRVDALCNVAGLSGKAGSAPTLAVNFFGLRALSEAMAPKIREGGSIVNAASIAGFGWRGHINRLASIVSIEGFPDVAKVVAENGI